MSDTNTRRIWTAGDYLPACERVANAGDAQVLLEHGLYADHCDGYEVLAWPCAVVVPILNRLLGGAA